MSVDKADRGVTGLRLQSVDLDVVLRAGAGARAALYLLDACRDAPSRGLALAAGVRGGVVRGLAPVNARAPQTVISFATAPGDVALDGPPGTHSPYAAALLRHLGTPGLEVQQMLTRVTGSVFQATARRQRPWTNASLDREFFLGPRPADDGAGERSAARDGLPLAEALAWAHASASAEPRDLEVFLERFPGSALAPFARRRLDALRPAAPATVQPELPAARPATAAPGAPASPASDATAASPAGANAPAPAGASVGNGQPTPRVAPRTERVGVAGAGRPAPDRARKHGARTMRRAQGNGMVAPGGHDGSRSAAGSQAPEPMRPATGAASWRVVR